MSPKHGNCANYNVIGQKKRPRPNEAQGMPILLVLGQGAPIPSGSGDSGFHPDTADRVMKNCVICVCTVLLRYSFMISAIKYLCICLCFGLEGKLTFNLIPLSAHTPTLCTTCIATSIPDCTASLSSHTSALASASTSNVCFTALHRKDGCTTSAQEGGSATTRMSSQSIKRTQMIN